MKNGRGEISSLTKANAKACKLENDDTSKPCIEFQPDERWKIQDEPQSEQKSAHIQHCVNLICRQAVSLHENDARYGDSPSADARKKKNENSGFVSTLLIHLAG